jgi:four helix bundle protein
MSFKFEKLDAWQQAIDFCDKIISIADGLPQRYQFSLGEQLRRASISIPTNIAEGSGRDNPKECRYFYTVAKGSVYEVVSLLVICRKRDLLADAEYQALYPEADRLAALIHGLARAQVGQRER